MVNLTELKGVWTNISMDDVLDWDENISICQTQSVRFIQNRSYPSACPFVIGSKGKASDVSTIYENCIFTKVEMFRASEYFARVEQVLELGSNSQPKIE